MDYLQNLRGAETLFERTTDAIIHFQRMAKRLNCCILVLSQLSNEMAKTPLGEYYSYKGSGAIRDAADKCLYLERKRGENEMKVVLLKNRQGPVGVLEVYFDLATGLIVPAEKREL